MNFLGRIAIFVNALVLILTLPVMAANWQTVETEHFAIHFTTGYEQLAYQAAAVAEEIYPIATAAVGHIPSEKTQIVLKDVTDSANGLTRGALFNGMSLYLAPFAEWPALTSGFPQKYDSWLYSLLLHEYIHVLHLDMNGGPAAAVRTVLGRVPIVSNLNTMQSFAWIEGLAVFYETRLANGGRADDPLYRMFLRANVLEHNLPEIDQVLGYYDLKQWRPGANVYLYGAALVTYIAENYGLDKIGEINRIHAAQGFPSLDLAMKKVLGKPLNQIWNECREWVKTTEGAVIDEVTQTGVVEGKRLTFSGERTGGATFLPNGDLLYLANSRKGFPAIRLLEADGTNNQLFSQYGSLSGRPSIDATGNEIVFSEAYPQDKELIANDLVLYDLKKKRRERLTIGARAVDPALSPDGEFIAYTQIQPFTAALALLNRKTGETEMVPLGQAVAGLGGPVFSPDGNSLAISVTRTGGWQDIALIDLAGFDVEWVTSGLMADVTPTWSPDGKYVFYSSDLNGIYNIYAYEVQSGKHLQITRVRTGAFQPAVSGNRLVYTGYTSEGFDLFELDLTSSLWLEVPGERVRYAPVLPKAVASQPAPLQMKKYKAWPTLAPKYWVPLASFSEEGAALSVMTSGEDALGRQIYSVQAGWDFAAERPLVAASYTLKGAEYGPMLGLEYSNLSGDQELSAKISDSSGRQTVISRGIGLAAIWPRTGTVKVDPALIFDAAIAHTTGAGSWLVRAQTGLSGHYDLDGAGQYLIASAGVGLAHEDRKKVSTRVVAGWAENHEFEVGGVSTSFPIRGLTKGAAVGDQAVAATLSWRPWELRIQRGYADIPIFLNSISVDLFVDAGSAGYGQLGEVQSWGGIEVNAPIELIYGAGGVGSASTLRLSAGYALPLSQDGDGAFYFAASLPVLSF